MYQSLTGRYSKYIAIAGMIMVMYIAYVFSFKHALEAINLNRQLTKEKNGDQSLSISYPQLENQHRFYLDALIAYHVKKEDRENRLWQTLSAIAVSKKVGISFVPSISSIVDTVAVQKGMVAQQFTVKGQYFNMIQLLDSINKTPGIGRIADFTLVAENKEEIKPSSSQLILKLSMVALAK